jgi:hypothetical protein
MNNLNDVYILYSIQVFVKLDFLKNINNIPLQLCLTDKKTLPITDRGGP